MELTLDSSLEIRSAPVPRQKKRRTKTKQLKSEDHIDELVMIALQRFFETKEYADTLWEQLGTKTKQSISLRVIDWFVTNYSKKNAVHYPINDKQVCIVWQEYKQKLRGYSKSRFDPFCRHKRIRFHLGPSRSIVTTVGQLNFFRWAIENKIIEFIQEHRKEIEKDMNDSYQVHYSDRRRPDVKEPSDRSRSSSREKDGGQKKRKKRREISKVANNGVCLFNIKKSS